MPRLAACLAVLLAATPVLADEPDLTSGTWHIGIAGLFGENNKGPKSLDIYPVFEDAKMVNALATARSFNTSIHLLQDSDIAIDPDAKTIAGGMTVLLTPDLWVPKDGQAFEVKIDIDGKIEIRDDEKRGRVGVISGGYTAKRVDGGDLLDGKSETRGRIYGGVGTNEPGWDNAVWAAGLTPEVPQGYIDTDAMVIRLGVADGKVNWGTLGLAAQAKWPAHKAIPFDVSSFNKATAAGKLDGRFEITGRHLHPGGDPAQKFTVELRARRVQGLIGMAATITPVEPTDDPSWPRHAYGRGGGRKGGGGAIDFDRVLWKHEIDNRPWFSHVEGFKPVQPGEHPRLLFRKDDVAALRERADTPQGRAIIERLRKLLGENGEAVTSQFSEVPPHNHKKTKNVPIGTFTTWHAAGFGLLYQVTGEKKYADLAKQCVELMLAGKYDVDNRYSWVMPGTDLRCGSVLGAMAYAYDFCYDAWPEDFRHNVAQEIQNFDKVTASAKDSWEAKKAKGGDVPAAPRSTDIEELVGRTGYPPGSNHYGSLIGGTSVALLAIHGDPGVDSGWVADRLAELESNVPRMLEHGFGDGGYYSEGFPPSRLSSEGGFIELLHALRTAAGRDYINVDRPHADALSTRWVYHVGSTGKGHFPSRGTYGGDFLYQDGVRASFALGFGAVKPEHRRALLWTYDTFFDALEPEGNKTWNAVTYPHYAAYALLHWPLEGPQDPDDVMPKVLVDRIHGYFVARNRWQDKNDIIVTHLIEYGPNGYYASRDGPSEGRAGKLRVFGFGREIHFDVGTNQGHPTHFVAGKDGSFTLTAGNALAVDMSKASGADLVVVTAGYKPRAKKDGKGGKGGKDDAGPTTWHTLTHGGKKIPVQVYTMQQGGEAPAVRIEANTIHVGGQSFTYDGTDLTPRVFNPAAQ